jgi:peptidoglycan hydrolase-like protein with peptidoglycan-binding domain
MRNALRRIAVGVLTTGMLGTMALGVSASAANAAVSAPRSAAVTDLMPALVWPNVRRGDSGLRVVKIQLLLIQHGITVKVDGKYGLQTELAVKFFQKRNRIFPANGVVGARTWQALIVTLRRGSRGAAVSAVQIELKFAYGFKTLKVDAVFGRSTERAVILFQKRYRVFPANGVVGPSTWNALVVHEK